MPAKKVWAPHGSVRRYRQGGCNDLLGGKAGEGPRCAKCQMAQREFSQGRKVGQAIPMNSNVTVLDRRRLRGKNASKTEQTQSNSEHNESKMGPTETAVEKQLGVYREEQPVRVEMALTAARILDNPEARGMHTQTMRQLEAITEKLTGAKKTKSRGRLAAVQSMTPNMVVRR